MFWNSETRLSFLRDASDRVELENREADSEILRAMESTAPVAIGGKWDEKLESDFITNIGRYRRYKYDSIRDLLRVIRNKLNHYRELPPDIQVSLVNKPLKHHHDTRKLKLWLYENFYLRNLSERFQKDLTSTLLFGSRNC